MHREKFHITTVRKFIRTISPSQYFQKYNDMDNIPAPPHQPPPDILNEITRVTKSPTAMVFNRNHPVVPPEVLEPVQLEVRKRIDLANARLTSAALRCRGRGPFNALIASHQEEITKVSCYAKKQLEKEMKSTLSNKEVNILRFAVGKRFTSWRENLEQVKQDSSTWGDRMTLWRKLADANKHQYDAYHLQESLIGSKK